MLGLLSGATNIHFLACKLVEVDVQTIFVPKKLHSLLRMFGWNETK